MEMLLTLLISIGGIAVGYSFVSLAMEAKEGFMDKRLWIGFGGYWIVVISLGVQIPS